MMIIPAYLKLEMTFSQLALDTFMVLYLDPVVSLSLILFEMRLEDELLDKNLVIDYGTLLKLRCTKQAML